MKRLYTLLYIAALCLAASAQNVTLSFKNTPLAEALKAIDQAQADKRVHFVFDDLENLQVTKTIKNKSAFEAVKAVCAKQPVGVEMKGGDIFVEADVKADSTRRINIVGKVIDGFLEIGLRDVQVSLLDADRNVLVDSMTTAYIQGAHNSLLYTHFYTDVPAARRNYIVRASMDGYIDVEQPVSVTDLTKDKVELPTLKMRKDNSVMLRDVTVSATRIKMFWRGDTLVYDATAFKLPEGSMLDDLIRQMPGVRMNEAGEIFVNERKVDELLLGSRSFMKGNRKVLLENLPYYTVKDIKVYEKTSDMSIALGRDLGDKSYVMDVNLKQEYQHGYIGNMEAAAGTEERWLGRAFLLAFTDRWRYTVHANSNNVNEGRHIGESDNWSPSRMAQNMQTTRSVAAEANYASKGRKLKNNISGEYIRSTVSTDMRQRRETFLKGMTPHSTTESMSITDKHWAKLREEFTLLKPFYVHVQGEVIHSSDDDHSLSAFHQYGDSLTTSMLMSAMDKVTSNNAFVHISAVGSINKKKELDLGTNLSASHGDNSTDRAQRFSVSQFADPASSSLTHNANDLYNRSNHASAELYLRHPLKMIYKLSSYTALSYSHSNQHAHDYLYHPDTLTLPSQLDGLRAFTDLGNSYKYRYTKNKETLRISLTKNKVTQLIPGYNLLSVLFNITLDIPLHQQRLAYQRETIDTVACYNSFHINPSIIFTPKFGKNKRNEISVNASFTTHDLDLLQTIAYRDDSQPLLVQLGNADLKARQTSTFSFSYANHKGPGKRELNLQTSYNYSHRDIAQSVCYNPRTGVYTYRPVNIGGSNTLTNTLSYTRYLDKAQRWNISSTANATLHHSVDQTMLTNPESSEPRPVLGGSAAEVTSRLNKVNTLTLAENAYIQYSKDALNIRATGDIRWRHSEGKMCDFSTLNAFDFQYGLNARYTLPLLKTTISADANMYSRRGYGSASLNTDDFVLNASLSQPLMKGKLIARLEAFDLLHNLSSTQYEVNAQGRTETWYRSLPHYVMAHLVYHWNKNPKKK